jgi:hypothetical protein
MAKPKHFGGCTLMRRMVIQHGTLKFGTGETTVDREETVERACEAPIFDEEGWRTGLCRSCRSGWTHPRNFPIETVAERLTKNGVTP